VKLAFEIPKTQYTGKIKEVTIGSGSKAVTIGGEEVLPFYIFEGDMPNPPRVAMEIWDYDPSGEWPKAALEPFKNVVSDPVEWAKMCVEEYGADILVIQLKSTDPNGMDRPADEAAEIAKRVIDSVDVPVVLWGTADNEKDEKVLRKIAEICEGKNVSLSPVEEANHKGIGASALAYKQVVVASTPIDVNLAKQLNILLENLGVPLDRIIIDPTTGGLGYGLEYTYSVIERIKMAALVQEDDKLQNPIITNVGNEVWKCKEAGQDLDEAPTLGDPERRGVIMECVTALCCLLAGADVVILRHPESVRLVKSFIDLMLNGGSAKDVGEISKRLPAKEADLLSLSPEPDLTIEEEEKKPVPKVKAPPKAKEPEKKVEVEKEAPKPKEEKVVELRPKVEEKKVEEEVEEKKAEERVEVREEDKRRLEEELRKKVEEEIRLKIQQEMMAKEELEKKKKEMAELEKKKKEEEEKRRAEEEERKKQEEVERMEAEFKELREKLSKELEKRREEMEPEEVIESLDMELPDRIGLYLTRIHKHQ